MLRALLRFLAHAHDTGGCVVGGCGMGVRQRGEG